MINKKNKDRLLPLAPASELVMEGKKATLQKRIQPIKKPSSFLSKKPLPPISTSVPLAIRSATQAPLPPILQGKIKQDVTKQDITKDELEEEEKSLGIVDWGDGDSESDDEELEQDPSFARAKERRSSQFFQSMNISEYLTSKVQAITFDEMIEKISQVKGDEKALYKIINSWITSEEIKEPEDMYPLNFDNPTEQIEGLLQKFDCNKNAFQAFIAKLIFLHFDSEYYETDKARYLKYIQALPEFCASDKVILDIKNDIKTEVADKIKAQQASKDQVQKIEEKVQYAAEPKKLYNPVLDRVRQDSLYDNFAAPPKYHVPFKNTKLEKPSKLRNVQNVVSALSSKDREPSNTI